MKVGLADLPLHWGKAPKWLFNRMVKLSREISEIIILEFGKEEFLKRISDPCFFQALGCVVGFDWHSSGITTTLTGALKEAKLEEYGIAVLGGKGKASRKVPKEIENLANNFSFSTKKIERLKYASKLVAKVDNSVLQDNFQLYHHCFIVSEDGEWVVVQQGMKADNRIARRYHWISKDLKYFVEEPHKAICCDLKQEKVLNLVAKKSRETRKCIVDLVNENPKNLMNYVAPKNSLVKYLKMPTKHFIDVKEYQLLLRLKEFQPKNFEELISFKGMGPKTLRALALISHLIFGTKLSFRDPVKFSFAHGGKDGTPYPVNRKVYDSSIKTLKEIIEDLKINKKGKLEMLRRLENRVRLGSSEV